ncbi:hypothetical protein [Acinetobacter shaoyimingii]|uniref:Lipoprotein n=1 Tax=Acinetobacter shaoyimingii TaxID=2715164 RepID=A0A6G8RU70_9GAMM|nr:hypothetical protein [Acinetobacter shaoyimingii]QIO05464.1 hypothetical protein G8E00_05595 [Acinetobacter shaoyimingii]
MNKKFVSLITIVGALLLTACNEENKSELTNISLEGEWYRYHMPESIVIVPLEQSLEQKQSNKKNRVNLLSKFKISTAHEDEKSPVYAIQVIKDEEYIDPDFAKNSITYWISSEIHYFIQGMYLGLLKPTNASQTWNFIERNHIEPTFQFIFKVIQLAKDNPQLNKQGNEYNNLDHLGKYTFKHPESMCIQFHAKKYKQANQIHALIFPFKSDQEEDATRCDLYNSVAIQELKKAFPEHGFMDQTEIPLPTKNADIQVSSASEVANTSHIVPRKN